MPSKDGTIVTGEPAIYLKGTVAAQSGENRVWWESNRGFSDLATVRSADEGRLAFWSSTSAIPLRPGINHVRIKALDRPGAATSVNIFYTPQAQTAPAALATTVFHGRQITYEVKNGLAIYQSDMILGNAAQIAAAGSKGPSVPSNSKGMRPEALTIAPNPMSPTGLWPVVNRVARVPYTITAASTANTDNIKAAITESNNQLAGVVQWEPASASDVNLVNFDFDPTDLTGTCEAYVGMVGGIQTIGGSANCTATTILHEMGHALGLYHEQSRADRDSFVNYMEENIDKPQHGNFDIIASSVDSGLYNYASIMEYGAFQFSKDGVSPVLETIPPGMVLSTSLPHYTTGDLDGIMRLYSHAPTAITVDTNPSGLQIIVDSVPCTAPCVFTSWTPGSDHTLSVPLDSNSQTLQALNGQNYIFGRWNSSSSNAQTVKVTSSLGNGTPLSPTTSPAITNYLASFIPVHPSNPIVAPAGDGTITASPTPSKLIIDGTSTSYYQDRQLITLTITPHSGFHFYDWYPSPFFSIYSNPYTFSVTDDIDTATANLVTDPITSITAVSQDLGTTGIFPGFAIGVVDGDGNTTTAYTPTNFDATYNGPGFAAGQTVTFSTKTQSPVTTNITYAFHSWTGAGTPDSDSLSVVVPASGKSTSTANFTPSFRAIVLPSLYCEPTAGDNLLGVKASPAGSNSIGTEGNLDTFFKLDYLVYFTASTSTSGLNFVGWSQDLVAGGSTNPVAYSTNGQLIGMANFNVPGTSDPLTITGVSPTPAVTTGAVNLTVTGTGFTTDPAITYTYLVSPTTGYFLFRSNTLTSGTQLTIDLEPGDLAVPGYYQVVVLNAVPSECNPSAYFTFPVTNSAGPPMLAITKSHTGDFARNQQNAQYTILVSNTGTGSTLDPVTVTENLPDGETLVSMSGSGWTCTGNTCTQSNTLAAGMSYGAITVTVDVTSNATTPQVNMATVSGGGTESATASDSTAITGLPAAVTPNAGTTPQSASIETAFGALAVTVTDAENKPLSGVNVKFTAPSSGPSGLFSNEKNSITVATTASGVASVPFAANGTVGGPYTVTATVAGVTAPANFSLTNTPGIPAAKLSATGLNLGSVIVGSTSAAKTVTLTNSGTGSLTLTGIAASGDFAETNPCPKSLAPKATCIISVTFTPTVTGTVSGALTITDGAGNSPQVVSLTGTGVNAVSIAPTYIPFGSVTVGATSAPQTATITNNSTGSVSLNLSASAGFASAGSGTAPCGATLAAKASCTVAVTFAPLQNGSIGGTLAVSGTSFATQLAMLAGSGTGGAANALTFSPGAVTFASQVVGTTSASSTITVTNSSKASVNIASFTASPDFAVVGSGTTPCGGTLASKAKCTMSVTFTPSATGSIKGSVAFTDSASVNPQIFNLAGTGVLPVTLSPTSLTFTAQAVGTTSAPQTVTLTNNQLVNLTSISLVSSGDYSVSAAGTVPCGSSVAAQGSCTFEVTFTPTNTGTINSAVTVTSSASNSPQVVKLTGTGK
jgi:Astacin (Peptidase family M12A)/Abnormal spindle-like microcephaly-assoc'd, ASPM-SPD-2-Hydin